MAHKGFDFNQYGTMVSKHVCDTCGSEFTVCPAAPVTSKSWDNCLTPTCSSYDPDRDVDKILENGGTLMQVPAGKKELGQA